MWYRKVQMDMVSLCMSHKIFCLWDTFRQLRDTTYYKNDPMVLCTVGLKTMPSVSTLSRILCKMDAQCYEQLRLLSKHLVLERLADLMPMRLMVDFDGSVLWTKSRSTVGTAVGYNTKEKGTRTATILCLPQWPRPARSMIATIGPETFTIPTVPMRL